MEEEKEEEEGESLWTCFFPTLKLHGSVDTPCNNIVTLSKALGRTLDRVLALCGIVKSSDRHIARCETRGGAKVVRSYYDARCALKPRLEQHTVDLNRNLK